MRGGSAACLKCLTLPLLFPKIQCIITSVHDATEMES